MADNAAATLGAGSVDTNSNPTPTATGTPWYQGQPEEVVGYIENKGWHKLGPAEAALQATIAHREATRFIGVPTERLLRLPEKDDDEAGWRAVHERLGAPKDPSGYKFDEKMPEDFRKTMAETAFKHGLSPKAAEEIAAQAFAQKQAETTKLEADKVAKLDAETAALNLDWGMHKQDNLYVARAAVRQFGLDAEVVDALQNQLGLHKTMNFFLEIGKRLGEDKFIVGVGGPSAPGGVTTQAGAIARLAELEKDVEFQKRLFAGDAQAKAEFQHVTRLKVGAGAA